MDHHATVINLSIGFSDMPLFAPDVTPICSAAAYAEAHEVVLVAASGNDGVGDNFPEAPAACGTVLSVAALDNTMHVTAYSSFDSSVSLAAPGDSIYSTVPTYISTTRYAEQSGTSMAAPFVSGVAALVLQQHPTWTPAQVRSRLESTAEDLGPAGYDPRNGYGAVDPAAAVGATAAAPAATPAISVNAFGFGDHYDSQSNLVIDETLVNWVPDASAVVTGYTVTSYTPTGTTVTSLPKTAVRWAAPTTIGGYVVTAQTAAGPIVAPPVWYSLAEQASPSSFQVKSLQKVKGTFTSKGSLVVSWTNPAANKGHADGVFISLNGEIVAQHAGPMPTHLTVLASHVPPGDLTLDVFVQSSTDGTVAVTHSAVKAHVPFSGTGTRVGTTRYRVTLQLADELGAFGLPLRALQRCEGPRQPRRTFVRRLPRRARPSRRHRLEQATSAVPAREGHQCQLEVREAEHDPRARRTHAVEAGEGLGTTSPEPAETDCPSGTMTPWTTTRRCTTRSRSSSRATPRRVRTTPSMTGHPCSTCSATCRAWLCWMPAADRGSMQRS